MTVVFSESFDTMGVNDGLNFGEWYDFVISHDGNSFWNQSFTLITGRLQGSAIQINSQLTGGSGNTYMYFTFDMAEVTQRFSCCFGFRKQATSTNGSLLQIYDQNFALQGYFYLDSVGNPCMIQGGTNTFLVTGSTPVSTNQWHMMEIALFISNTAGWVELYQDGTLIGGYYGSTGTSRGTANGNTRGSGSTINGCRFIRFGSGMGISNGTFNYGYDDIVLVDGAGTANNDHPGNVVVVGQLPNNNGTYSQMTRVGGTSSGNYTAVNDNPINSDTSYVASNTIGAEDTYQYPTLPASTSNILAVVAKPCWRIDDAGSRRATTHVIVGASEADFPGSDVILTPNYAITKQIMELNPISGVAWTLADLTSSQFGPKVTA